MAAKDLSSLPFLKKRKVYKCTYKVEWSKKYPVTKSNLMRFNVFCARKLFYLLPKVYLI